MSGVDLLSKLNSMLWNFECESDSTDTERATAARTAEEMRDLIAEMLGGEVGDYVCDRDRSEVDEGPVDR